MPPFSFNEIYVLVTYCMYSDYAMFFCRRFKTFKPFISSGIFLSTRGVALPRSPIVANIADELRRRIPYWYAESTSLTSYISRGINEIIFGYLLKHIFTFRLDGVRIFGMHFKVLSKV